MIPYLGLLLHMKKQVKVCLDLSYVFPINASIEDLIYFYCDGRNIKINFQMLGF
jgi:hypothetical protein